MAAVVAVSVVQRPVNKHKHLRMRVHMHTHRRTHRREGFGGRWERLPELRTNALRRLPLLLCLCLCRCLCLCLCVWLACTLEIVLTCVQTQC